MKSFEGFDISVAQATVSLQTIGLATQLLKIKKHECIVKLIDTVESAKYTIKEAMQAIQELTS